MKNLFLIAALAATVLASCEKGPDGNGQDKGNARMNVVISFPETMGTRAADSNASSKDVAIESVTVFVFNDAGNAAPGNGTSFLKSDFSSVGDNKYELKANKRVQTTAGTKRIYVGMNLPDDLKAAANESTLIEKASTDNLESTGSVAMLSAVVEQELVSQNNDGDPTPEGNIVPATVKRLVAKVSVTANAQATWDLNDSQQSVGATYSVTPQQFSVGGLATTFYPVQRLDGNGKLVSPGDKVGTDVATFRNLNPNGTTISNLSAFYVPENSDPTRVYLQGSLTYAVVSAEFTFAKFATVDGSGVVFEDANLVPGTMVYAFRIDDVTYFCKTANMANQVKNELGANPTILASDVYMVDDAGKLYTYYHLFLNQDDADILAVKRNQFLDIKVTGVKGLGSPEETPKPDVPVVKSTYLEVSIDILAWDHRTINQELGR